jgi:uncharacterized protein
MTAIHYYKKPLLRQPVMLAGWPGIGAVSQMAVDYWRKALQMELIAEISTGDLLLPDAFEITQGQGVLSSLPRILFFASQAHNLTACLADSQFHGLTGKTVVDRFFQVVTELKVRLLCTTAALPSPLGYKQEPQLSIAANDPGLQTQLSRDWQLPAMTEGKIAGLNGTLVGLSAHLRIPAACFLVTIPAYALHIPVPKAALSLVRAWSRIFSVPVNTALLEHDANEADQVLSLIEAQIEGLVRSEKPANPGPASEKARAPEDFADKIEILFKKAAKDKTAASNLKKELDRRGLFRQYEDRFLDLFKNN